MKVCSIASQDYIFHHVYTQFDKPPISSNSRRGTAATMKYPFALPVLFASTALSLAFTSPMTRTYTYGIPSGALPYTTTLPACGTVDGYVLVAAPTSPFVPGTTTILVPPQASAKTRTFTNAEYNLTQVLLIQPLEGPCVPKDFSILTPSAAGAFNLSQYTATGVRSVHRAE